MRVISWDSKDPNEVDDFAIDWTNQLKGETIVAAQWSVINAAGVAIDASSIASPFAKVRLSGGNLNDTCILTCSITTNTARQLSQRVKVSLVKS